MLWRLDGSLGSLQISAWRARGRVPLGADLAASLVELRQQ